MPTATKELVNSYMFRRSEIRSENGNRIPYHNDDEASAWNIADNLILVATERGLVNKFNTAYIAIN